MWDCVPVCCRWWFCCCGDGWGLSTELLFSSVLCPWDWVCWGWEAVFSPSSSFAYKLWQLLAVQIEPAAIRPVIIWTLVSSRTSSEVKCKHTNDVGESLGPPFLQLCIKVRLFWREKPYWWGKIRKCSGLAEYMGMSSSRSGAPKGPNFPTLSVKCHCHQHFLWYRSFILTSRLASSPWRLTWMVSKTPQLSPFATNLCPIAGECPLDLSKITLWTFRIAQVMCLPTRLSKLKQETLSYTTRKFDNHFRSSIWLIDRVVLWSHLHSWLPLSWSLQISI